MTCATGRAHERASDAGAAACCAAGPVRRMAEACRRMTAVAADDSIVDHAIACEGLGGDRRWRGTSKDQLVGTDLMSATATGSPEPRADRPGATVQAATWARPVWPSLARMCSTWPSAARPEITRGMAMSLLDTAIRDGLSDPLLPVGQRVDAGTSSVTAGRYGSSSAKATAPSRDICPPWVNVAPVAEGARVRCAYCSSYAARFGQRPTRAPMTSARLWWRPATWRPAPAGLHRRRSNPKCPGTRRCRW
jgi:hypothetical protein